MASTAAQMGSDVQIGGSKDIASEGKKRDTGRLLIS